jgi:hypothetical protein
MKAWTISMVLTVWADDEAAALSEFSQAIHHGQYDEADYAILREPVDDTED